MVRTLHLVHALVFFVALLVAYYKAKLPDFTEELVYLKVERLSQWELGDGYASASVNIEQSEIEKLEGRRATLIVRTFDYIPESDRLEVLATVRVKNNSILLISPWYEVEELPPKESLRKRLMKKLEERIKEPHLRAIALAFIFGEERKNLPLEVEEVFLKTGLIHVLVVSGLHVGLVFLFFYKLFPRAISPYLGALGVLFYSTFLVPPNPPAIRATLMFLFYVLALILYRRYCSLCALFFSGTLMLFFAPHFVFSYSFWLSFFAVLYIILTIREWELSNTAKTFLVSFGAFTGVSPLLVSFTYVYPISLILSPLLSPLVLAYAFFAFLSLFTLFELPLSLLFMNFSGELLFRILKVFSDYSLGMSAKITKQEAFIVLIIGAIALYFLKGFNRLIPLVGINFYLLLR